MEPIIIIIDRTGFPGRSSVSERLQFQQQQHHVCHHQPEEGLGPADVCGSSAASEAKRETRLGRTLSGRAATSWAANCELLPFMWHQQQLLLRPAPSQLPPVACPCVEPQGAIYRRGRKERWLMYTCVVLSLLFQLLVLGSFFMRLLVNRLSDELRGLRVGFQKQHQH